MLLLNRPINFIDLEHSSQYLSTGGVHDGGNVGSSEIYTIDTRGVAFGPDLLIPTHGLCGVKWKKKRVIYFVGGNKNGDTGLASSTTGTQKYDMDERALSLVLGQMSVGRRYHTCAVMEEESLLMVAGGLLDNEDRTDSVEILNFQDETWSTARPLPSNTYNVWASGEIMFNWETELYQYEVASNTWLEIEDVPFDLAIMKPYFLQVEAGAGSFCPYI